MEHTIPLMRRNYETLSDMVLFVEVARCGGYRQAASRLEIPVATLSRRIALMEKRLGMQLLLRTTRSVTLAHGAKNYFERCLLVLEAADAAQAVLLAGDKTTERIRISMPVDLGQGVLASIIASYCQQRSGLMVDFDLSTAARDVFRDPVDLVFRIGRPMDDRVVARKIGAVEAGLYASPMCLKSHGNPSAPKDLVSMPCLGLVTAAGAMPWKISNYRWQQAPGQVTLSANNVGLLRTLAVQGHGVALLPRYMAAEHVHNGTLVELLPLETILAWPLYAITASRSTSPHIRGLIAHVRTNFGELEQ